MSIAAAPTALCVRRDRYGQIVIVAECETRPHGFAWVAIDARMHLYALYVHSQSGGRGIGTALLATAEHLASQRGVTRLFVAASRNAIGFYARLGYAAEREFVLHHHDEQGAIALPMCKMSKPLGLVSGEESGWVLRDWRLRSEVLTRGLNRA